VRRNDEVEAQRRRWTFYEFITLGSFEFPHPRARFKLLIQEQLPKVRGGKG
jgi:hypothetical protein